MKKTDMEVMKDSLAKARLMGLNLVVKRTTGGAIGSIYYTSKPTVESFRKEREISGELQFISLGGSY